MNVENGTPWKSTSVAVALPIRVMRTGVVGKMAEVVQGTNGGLYLADRQTRLFLGGVSTHDEVRAIGGGTAQHTEVCPFEEAEREDFFHRLVGGKLAEEKEELWVRQVRPRLGEG